MSLNPSAKPFSFGDPNKVKEFVPSWMPALKPSTGAAPLPSTTTPTTSSSVPTLPTPVVEKKEPIITSPAPVVAPVSKPVPAVAKEEIVIKKEEPKVTNESKASTAPVEEKDIEDMNDEELEAFIKKQEELEAKGLLPSPMKDEVGGDEASPVPKEEEEVISKPKVILEDSDPREHMNIVTIGSFSLYLTSIQTNSLFFLFLFLICIKDMLMLVNQL